MPRTTTGNNLTVAYISALLIIGILATVEFGVQRTMLRDSEITQRVKDISASQRALVQGIALNAQGLSFATDPLDKQQKRTQIVDLLSRLDRSLVVMDRDFSGIRSITYLFAENLAPIYYTESLGLRRELTEFRDQVKKLTDLDPTLVRADNALVRYVVDKAERHLHNKLDIFVTLTVFDTQKRLSSLAIVVTIAYSLVIILLLLTGIFVFRPVVSSVVNQQKSQTEANERLADRAAALEQSRGKLRCQTRILKSVLNTMGDALIVVDENGHLVIQNPAADRLFGGFDEGTAAEQWHAAAGLYHPDTDRFVDMAEGPICRALHQGRFNEMLIKVNNTQTFEPKIVSATGRRMVDEDSVGQGAVLSFHDVSDRISKEQELLEAKVRAESANISKTQFLANISHEIRTPMSAILGFADRLLLSSLNPVEHQNIVDVIRRNARSLMSIIDDLLDISRIETGQFSVEHEFVELGEIVSEVYSLLMVKAQEKNLSFDVEFKGRLPEYFYSDAVRLRQILINVVGNAIKFTNEGGVKVTVHLVEDSLTRRPMLAFDVADSGCGIRAENVDKLFKPFAQIDSSTTRKYGGTGLGLNLSRRLAQGLGGDLVLLSSVQNCGSVFRAYIDPGALMNAMLRDEIVIKKPQQSREELSKEVFPETGLENLDILIVDDGEENRELFSYFITRAGATATLASDGLEGVKKAQVRTFDLILMDIQMPNLDGYQALAALHQQKYRGPVVALTAHAMKEEVIRCKQAGFNGHLPKPIDARKLVEAIRKFVEQNPVNKDTMCGGPIQALASTMPPVTISAEQPRQSYPEIVQRFRQNLPLRLLEMLRAADADDRELLAKMAHQLKGTAGACGMPELTERMAELETALDEGNNQRHIRNFVAELKLSLGEQGDRSIL